MMKLRSLYTCHNPKKNHEIRLFCDASKLVSGAFSQQSQSNGEWKPICFALMFLTNSEAKFSNIELETLAIVWVVELFENYVVGVLFIFYFRT